MNLLSSLRVAIAITIAFLSPAPALAAPLAPPPPTSPLNVAIVWNHHQPFYPKRPGENVYSQPWVRLHATKDYVRMATAAAKYPGIKVTINLTPSLLAQLDDLARGAKDRAFVLSTIDSRILTPDQKREIHTTFFSAGPHLMRPLPAYPKLRIKPAGQYTSQDWRDLQVYFNLAWTAPEVQREPRIAALIRKGKGYTENDKLVVLQRHTELVRDVIPTHVRLEKAGRIEVTTSPYAHPILPLLVDSDIASQSNQPGPPLPPRFRYPEDAQQHLDMAIAAYKRHFGHAPRGMWPAEGAVSQSLMPLFRRAGVTWIATDEKLLEKTIGKPLRKNGALDRPDLLTGLWRAQDGPAILFRDHELSDLIAFTYGSWDPARAAADLTGRVGAISRRIPRFKPAMLGIVLDGENAWKSYPGNGEAFLDALYSGLGKNKMLRVTTPGEVFARNKATALSRPLWSGSWVDGTFSTWIGEPDENAAWTLLGNARAAIAEYAASRGKDRKYGVAMEAIRAAEGSDWFRWYGKDQDSGHDADFDQAFRDYLAAAYRAVSRPVPEEVLRPAGAVVPAKKTAAIHPRLDGKGGPAWAGAIEGRKAGGAMQQASRVIDHIQVGADRVNLYLAVDYVHSLRPTGLVLGFPKRPGGVPRAGLPFLAQFVGDCQPGASGSLTVLTDPPARHKVHTAWGTKRLEVAVPWGVLGARGGEDLAVSVLELGASPYPDLPVHLTVPPLPDRSVISLVDPEGDARGARTGDITRFSVEDAGRDWAFVWTLAEVEKGSGDSRHGLARTRLEAYVDVEPAQPLAGGFPLLPGRPMRVHTPWRAAVVVDGAKSGVYSPGGVRVTEIRLAVDRERRTVSASLTKGAVPGNPRRWGFLAASFSPDASRSVLDAVGQQIPVDQADPRLNYIAPVL